MVEFYPQALPVYLKRGIALELLSPDLLKYDLAKIADAIEPVRDLQFTYLGLQTLYDRYFLHSNDVRFELPQLFFMRVAMGLAINEEALIIWPQRQPCLMPAHYVHNYLAVT